ncbi:MAG: hypothetical protein KJO82_09300, partial [Gammaproteobacteria bacterium]|nr:hypothetical protein [Gammaproteobacteria bacterium]
HAVVVQQAFQRQLPGAAYGCVEEILQVEPAYLAAKRFETVFRGDMLTTLKLRMTAADADTCYLQVDDDASAEANKRRQAWLARES